MTTVMSVACSALWRLESHVGGEQLRAAPGGKSRDSARRRAARDGQRKAPNCESGLFLHINIVLTTFTSFMRPKTYF
eukprot:1072146-Pleurochrysis_carterae.AAC.1